MKQRLITLSLLASLPTFGAGRAYNLPEQKPSASPAQQFIAPAIPLTLDILKRMQLREALAAQQDRLRSQFAYEFGDATSGALYAASAQEHQGRANQLAELVRGVEDGTYSL